MIHETDAVRTQNVCSRLKASMQCILIEKRVIQLPERELNGFEMEINE